MLTPFLFAALTAAAPQAISADPCPPALVMPPEGEAWRRSVYAPGVTKSPPPPIAAITPYLTEYKKQREKDWADVCRYHADNQRLIALPASARQVVFMGDSITEGWGYGDAPFFAPGWINRGISGQTTPQMLVRFPQDVIALKPRVVHIMAGTNDVAGNTGPMSLEMTEANIAAMVTLAKANGIRVVLAAVPPSNRFSWQPALAPAPKIAALNAWLKAYAARERVTFVDYGAVWATADGGMQPKLTFDGVHPNADGYVAIRGMATTAVKRAMR